MSDSNDQLAFQEPEQEPIEGGNPAADKKRVSKKMAGAKPYMPDPSLRFQGDGVVFKAKLFGTADVNEPKGDVMCQTALNLLKAAVKTTGEHKQKITMRINLNGITLLDQVNQLKLYEHPVNKISFIAKDGTDNRAFGYVIGDKLGKHVFYGIRTEKTADQVVLTLRDLFQVVYDIKKKEAENTANPVQTATEVTVTETPSAPVTSVATGQPATPATDTTDNAFVAPATGTGEPEKKEEAVKRQDSAGHLLDLLADLTFEPTPSQPASTQSAAAFATSMAWTTTPAQSDPFTVNQHQFNQGPPATSSMGTNGFAQTAPVQAQSRPFQQQPFTNPQQHFVNQQPQQQPFMGQPLQQQQFSSQPFGTQPQQQPFQTNPYQQQQANPAMYMNQPMPNNSMQPAQQQPMFGQPQVQAQQAQSVFGQDPFFSHQAPPQQAPPAASPSTNPFNAPVLQPRQVPTATSEQVPTRSDLFSDLNPLPGSQPPKSRDPFSEMKKPPKPKLNEMMPQQQQPAVHNNNDSSNPPKIGANPFQNEYVQNKPAEATNPAPLISPPPSKPRQHSTVSNPSAVARPR